MPRTLREATANFTPPLEFLRPARDFVHTLAPQRDAEQAVPQETAQPRLMERQSSQSENEPAQSKCWREL